MQLGIILIQVLADFLHRTEIKRCACHRPHLIHAHAVFIIRHIAIRIDLQKMMADILALFQIEVGMIGKGKQGILISRSFCRDGNTAVQQCVCHTHIQISRIAFFTIFAEIAEHNVIIPCFFDLPELLVKTLDAAMVAVAIIIDRQLVCFSV